MLICKPYQLLNTWVDPFNPVLSAYKMRPSYLSLVNFEEQPNASGTWREFFLKLLLLEWFTKTVEFLQTLCVAEKLPECLNWSEQEALLYILIFSVRVFCCCCLILFVLMWVKNVGIKYKKDNCCLINPSSPGLYPTVPLEERGNQTSCFWYQNSSQSFQFEVSRVRVSRLSRVKKIVFLN